MHQQRSLPLLDPPLSSYCPGPLVSNRRSGLRGLGLELGPDQTFMLKLVSTERQLTSLPSSFVRLAPTNALSLPRCKTQNKEYLLPREELQ